ncbi:hypothetical protein CDD82_942 [Ophiocordyceps australis]|uniref:Major facilitator superfamily (MFS) profile domain-containing protein n=1 Tax=Ophiocordyceps australis TaxID=1399860 RepID=A0A2C5ZNH7_9HYPO|nr:hypothetical protein CDD82_942 [Ophiocordyceps australis]
MTSRGSSETAMEVLGHPPQAHFPHGLEEIDGQQNHDDTLHRGLGALDQMRSKISDEQVISWERDDAENPNNWPSSKKHFILSLSSMLVFNSTLGSALPSMAMPSITADFGLWSAEQKALPISIFLIGYVVGPIIWGPLSEHFGRRMLTVLTFVAFMLFTMACALAPTWPALLVFRLFCGVFASAPIAIVAGILADLFDDAKTRGRAFAIFMVTTVFGPIVSPLLSGFTSSTIGWRWAFWIALIYAGLTLALILFLPETFAPILLARRAARMRATHGSSKIVAPRDLENTNIKQLLTVVLARPLRMLVSEPIVSAICLYLALVYAIFYMSFQAFPLIFRGVYGLAPGVAGLCYLPIGGGTLLTIPIFWKWDAVLARMQSHSRPWLAREEFRRLPLACFGGPLFATSLFWLGFSARPSVVLPVPMLAGIFFGMGFVLIFMALLNYLTDAYQLFAASANAASSCTRSLFAVFLPLATTAMFDSLGIAGACALLGGLSAAMCIIPFVFLYKGPSLRKRSHFCILLTQRKEEFLRTMAEQERQSYITPASALSEKQTSVV